MSALTKIFIVLLVILSVIQAAGVTVWVNRQESFNLALKTALSDRDKARANAAAAENDRTLADQAAQLRQTQMQGQIQSQQKDIDTLRATVTDRDTQIAQLTNNLAQATAGGKSANDALAVAQKTLDTQNAQLADLRKSDLDLQKRYGEATFAINDLTNKFDVTNRQWRDAEEQITQLQSQNGRYQDMLHKAGVSEANPRNLTNESLIPLEGVVRSRTNSGGVAMATISLGSADKVAKGMSFKVIDPRNSTNPFLGYLIVDRVEPNEAIGHLQGPRVNDIQVGDQVRTQL